MTVVRLLANWLILFPAFARELQDFRVWGKFVFRMLELTDTSTNSNSQVKVGHALDQSRSVQSRGPERAHQTMRRHGDRRGRVADFRDSFEKWILNDDDDGNLIEKQQ